MVRHLLKPYTVPLLVKVVLAESETRTVVVGAGVIVGGAVTVGTGAGAATPFPTVQLMVRIAARALVSLIDIFGEKRVSWRRD
jgi:hypothetical protein